jgi:hypothetical protein
MIASSCAAVVLAGAVPSRAEAGIARVSIEAKTAIPISEIRFIVVSSGSRICAFYHNFPIVLSFQADHILSEYLKSLSLNDPNRLHCRLFPM